MGMNEGMEVLGIKYLCNMCTLHVLMEKCAWTQIFFCTVIK